MEKDELIQKLQFICKSFSDILGVVILFGSYSRNEATETSDIDLYIESKDTKMTTSKLCSNKRYREFKYALYDSFPLSFDVLAYGGKRDLDRLKKSALWKQIKKDGVCIYNQRAEAV